MKMTSKLCWTSAAVASVLLAQDPPDFVAATPAFQIGSAAGPRTFEFVAGEMVMGAPVKGAPYSADAVTETIQTLADGNRIVNRSTAKIYRDSEGRERREQSLQSIGPFAPQGGEPVQTVFISDPVAGVNYSLHVKEHIAMKMPAPSFGAMPAPPPIGERGQFNVMIHRGGATAGMPMPPPPGAPQVMFFQRDVSGAVIRADNSAPKSEQLGSQYVDGVQATGTRDIITIPAGRFGNEKPIEITDERWYSQQLQVTVRSEHSDPRMGKTAYSLHNISLAEPSAALFQVPADYSVKEPQMDIQRIERKVEQKLE